jgi:23S rRNA (cytosine1962-C5)-methyltransferase
MTITRLRLKKNEDRRLRAGHCWIYSNEVDIAVTPLKSLVAGQEVLVEAADKTILGLAYVNPHSLILGRLVSRNSTHPFNEDLFIRRINMAAAGRDSLYPKPFYRLIFGESDNLPGLVVDRFGDHLVVQINTAGMEAKKDIIVSALQAALPNTQSILFRNDSSARQQEGLESNISIGFGNPPQKVLLEENDVAFHAPLWEGQKTGWFFDHRLNRLRLKDYVADKRVLDVFSYLGGWGIQAAVWGAKEVHCLDSSAFAVESIKENAELNSVANKVHTICDDAFVGMKNLQQAKEKFDVIILDPPAFVKKQKDKKEGLLAYQRINEMALKLLAPGGILISCSCSMHITYEELMQALRRASLHTRQTIQILERGHQAQDHPVHIAIPETDYLKMIIARNITE